MYHRRVVQFITANHEPFFILFKNMLAISIRISSAKYAWHSGKRLQSSDCTVLVGTPPGPPVCNARVTGFISHGLKYYLPLLRKHVSQGCEDFHCQNRI